MDLGDKKARGVADFAAEVNGNENNSRQEQPQRRQDGRKQAGACRDERRQQQESETNNSRQPARIDPTAHAACNDSVFNRRRTLPGISQAAAPVSSRDCKRYAESSP